METETETKTFEIKLYNKVIDEIADMVWNKHFCLISDMMYDFEKEVYDNTDSSEFKEIDFEKIEKNVQIQISKLLQRKQC